MPDNREENALAGVQVHRNNWWYRATEFNINNSVMYDIGDHAKFHISNTRIKAKTVVIENHMAAHAEQNYYPADSGEEGYRPPNYPDHFSTHMGHDSHHSGEEDRRSPMPMHHNGASLHQAQIPASGGFFANANGPFQVSHCEMNDVQGDQIVNHYNSIGSFAWAQLLVQVPPSVLITGHGGYIYFNKLCLYLSSNTNQKPSNTLMAGDTSYYRQMHDASILVNTLLLLFIIFRKFIITMN